MKTIAPDGTPWRVLLRITPWRVHTRGKIADSIERALDWGGLPDGFDDAFGWIVLALIALPAIVVLAVFFGELLLLLLVLPIVVLVRVAFGRPWAIDVYRAKALVRRESVVGWHASRKRAAMIAWEIAAGAAPESPSDGRLP